ncbi:SDR family NAD(P)-dependent oxidoreductase [Novosphingobium sp. JCM 18896]|uniref:SDR family NAD(P)-dependent oxidoreductase n=1 Tax=Novosphingobium sp. JCM 18896 TaxID=2989731 RepID=UPI002223C476|nr:SDR family NAD(P)-dependent oxidoreductase [Novosphingobium sp. JCM 18896]MCW1428736.1 SDR family oxidoreductase [Novosphingobium sp. JCM 18896]
MTGRVALVTGAAAGLGRASALRLAEVGADLAITDVAEAGLEETAQTIRALGRKVLVLPLDLSQRANCRVAVERTVAEFGRLDSLCNVAGVMIPGPSASMTDEAWDLTMAVNLAAPFFLIRAAIPHLLEAKGAVVNVTSCAAFQGQAYFAAYCATKSGLANMTKALAMEFTNQPIRINAVAPGGMMTGLTDGMKLLPPDTDWPLVQRIGSPRGLCEIEDVAETVTFLATDAARGYHGSVIQIDAGVTAG